MPLGKLESGLYHKTYQHEIKFLFSFINNVGPNAFVMMFSTPIFILALVLLSFFPSSGEAENPRHQDYRP